MGLVVALVIMLPSATRADLSFENITGNCTEDLSGQLSVVITDEWSGLDSDEVAFVFYNDVGIQSSISEVYFDDGALLSFRRVENSTGVLFGRDEDIGTEPADLPGGNSLDVPFVTTEHYSADTPTGSPELGINASGEYAAMVFEVDGGLSAVMEALNLGFTDPAAYGSLRIGLHVISIGEAECSDSYVLTPLPGAAILGLIGLGIAGIKLRKYA
jgi:hypothetical protein